MHVAKLNRREFGSVKPQSKSIQKKMNTAREKRNACSRSGHTVEIRKVPSGQRSDSFPL